jgi:hypothetical protein
MENIILTPKIKILSRKKFCPPFCMKTFNCAQPKRLTKILIFKTSTGKLRGKQVFYGVVFFLVGMLVVEQKT